MRTANLGILAALLSSSAVVIPGNQRQMASPPQSGGRMIAPAAVGAAVPFFPGVLPYSDVTGKVVLLATVDADGAANAKLNSCSDSTGILCRAALQNFTTWEFVRGQPGSFEVTYNYEFAARSTVGLGNPRVIFDFPNAVTITMPRARPPSQIDPGGDPAPTRR